MIKETRIFMRCVFVLLMSAASATSFAFGPMSPGHNPSVVSETTGVIRYSKISDGSFRGEEHWRILVHPDGSRTVTMTVRLDATEVSRVTTLRVDSRFRPLDAYQTLWTGGDFKGSGYFWVQSNMLNSVVTTSNGVLQQSVGVPEHFSWVTHPLGADGLHMWYYDEAVGGVQVSTVFNTDTLGLTVGSILGRVHEVDLKLIGDEIVTVPAGQFATKRYLMDGRLEIWVDTEQHLMVRMRNTAKDRLYELTQWATTELN